MTRDYLHLTAILLILFIFPIYIVGQDEVRSGKEDVSENLVNQEEDELEKENLGDPISLNLGGDHNKETSDDFNSDEEEERAKRKRIVDARTIKERRSLIGNFFLKPFRAIAPIVTNRLTQFEENREYELLFGFKSDFPKHPQFGSISPGSGFGVGFNFSTEDHLSKDFRIVGSSLVTFSKYVENTAGVEITPQRFAKNKLKINLIARQSIRPKEDFFGTGANSFRSERTTFFQRQIGARLDASWEVNKKIKVGAFTELTRNDITDGSDARGIPITSKFDSQTLAGLDRNIRLLDSGIFVELENRDEPDSPHSGWFTRFSFSDTESPGRSNFGWHNYQFDSRAYIPISSKDRVLALRLLGDLKDIKGGSAIPFFRLAKLGDNETLRGYELYRYQGINALHLNIEYRFKLIQGIETGGFRGMEAIFFGDFGQVFNKRKELRWANIQSSWGGGLQFTSRKSVAMAVLYAQSPEGGRLIMRFGKTF